MNYIGISNQKLAKVADHLNNLLCTYSVYYQNLRVFHWNVKGQNFFELHKEFESLYNDAKLRIDEIAERVLTLGYQPIGAMSAYVKRSNIDEADKDISDELMVTSVMKNQQVIIEMMRECIEEAASVKDEGTVDMLGTLIFNIEKRTWMLRTWLSKVHSAEFV